MRERDAPGETGPGRQVAAVTGAWLPGAAAAGPGGILAAPGGPRAGPAGSDGTLAGAEGGPEFLINLGTSHPSAHGMLRLRLTLDGDRITAAEPEIGFMHRGAEKLFEVRDYRQIVVLANRHDWLGAFASELGVALAAERLAGIEVPPRAVWARTMLAELNRALSHLAFLSSYPPEIVAAGPGEAGPDTPGGAGQPAAARAAFAAREAIQAVMEEISGGRMHYMFNRVGGLKEEIPAGWLSRARRVIDQVRAALPEIGGTLGQDGFRARTRGIGALSAAQVRQYGVSGPAARACGVDFDLRRDEPYLAYGELAGVLRVPVRAEGDCLARFECLRDQLAVALDLAQECADRLAGLPQGPLSARLPKVFKVPEGHAYAWTEGPLGLSGYYLVSRGGKTPWRLKLRSASFSNMAVLPDLLPGHRVADLAAILGSLFFVVGDMDR
jgi:NADH-quinone oxidoreductase subunit D